jgi:L-lactate dehydrogenase complex protein LldG
VPRPAILGDLELIRLMSDLAAIFATRLESVGGAARWCEAPDVPDLVVETASAFPNQPVIYTGAVASLLPGLLPALEGRGVPLVAARSIDDALASPVALSTGELAIAETGSVLTANRELIQRAPTMLSTIHFIIVPEEKLVADLDAAGDWLRDNVASAPYVTFMTGPSRTADIQRTLTIGVQGPREVIVIFLRHPAAPA